MAISEASQRPLQALLLQPAGDSSAGEPLSLPKKQINKYRHFLQQPGSPTTLRFPSDCTKLSERKQKQATNYSLAASGRALSTSEVCPSPSRSSLPVTHHHLAGAPRRVPDALPPSSPPARCGGKTPAPTGRGKKHQAIFQLIWPTAGPPSCHFVLLLLGLLQLPATALQPCPAEADGSLLA